MRRDRKSFQDLIEEFNTSSSINECWIWGSLDARGYGRYSGKLAHRLSYEYFNGSFDKKLFVCHKCDNPSCVNPEHLFLGDSKANMDDMRSKGRARYVGSSILTSNELKKLKTMLPLLPKRRCGRVKFWAQLDKNYGMRMEHLRALVTGKTERMMDV